MTTPTSFPNPTSVSAPFWEGAAQGVLRLQRCQSCHRAHHYPRVMCPFCGSQDLEWRDATGWGIVYSFAHQPSRDGDGVMIILVDLEEGPRVLAVLEGARDGLAIGTPVTAAWRSEIEDRSLLVFELAPES